MTNQLRVKMMSERFRERCSLNSPLDGPGSWAWRFWGSQEGLPLTLSVSCPGCTHAETTHAHTRAKEKWPWLRGETSILHLFATPSKRLMLWHSFWHILWHSFWHSIWQSIWHMTWSDILSGIYSDILSGILSGIFPGIDSGILSNILSGKYSDILSDIFFWHSICHMFWHSIWLYLAISLAFYRTCILTFCLAFSLAWVRVEAPRRRCNFVNLRPSHGRWENKYS